MSWWTSLVRHLLLVASVGRPFFPPHRTVGSHSRAPAIEEAGPWGRLLVAQSKRDVAVDEDLLSRAARQNKVVRGGLDMLEIEMFRWGGPVRPDPTADRGQTNRPSDRGPRAPEGRPRVVGQMGVPCDHLPRSNIGTSAHAWERGGHWGIHWVCEVRVGWSLGLDI